MTRTAAAVVVLAVVLGGCRERSDTRAKIAALGERLEQIDRRVAATEKRVEAIAELAQSVKDLERRLATAESRPAPEGTTPPAEAPAEGAMAPEPPDTLGFPNPWSGLSGPGGESRRAAVAALAEEFRSRFASIQDQYRGARGSREQQQALDDLRRWYRERLRTLVTQAQAGREGEPPPRQ